MSNSHLLSLSNISCTLGGGMHLGGVKAGRTQTLKGIAGERRQRQTNVSRNSEGDALRGIISIQLTRLNDAEETRVQLSNTEAREIIPSGVSQVLIDYQETQPSVADSVWSLGFNRGTQRICQLKFSLDSPVWLSQFLTAKAAI